MATIKDVAREAGVSLGTVSNVINNLTSVSEENRAKVINAIEKLKYTPNNAARMLKTRISKSIGLVIPDISNPFYPELARGAEDAANRHGYTVFLCNSDRDSTKQNEYINALMEKNVDGIILVKADISSEDLLELEEKCRIVLVDTDESKHSGSDAINVDDYGGAVMAMNLLYDYGHRRIAFISGLLESPSSRCRQEAYTRFLAEKGLEFDCSLIKRGGYDWHSGYRSMVEILRQVEIPTAVFAANDLMAIGAMKAIRERRMEVPHDISVIGYDDIDMASLCSPQLTTIRQPKYELGSISVEKMIKRLNAKDGNGNTCERVTTLKTEVILRESVGYAKK